MTIDFSLPGQPGDSAEQKLVKEFGASSFDTYVAAVTVPDGQTVEGGKDKVAMIFTKVHDAVPGTRLIDFDTTGDDGFISDDKRTTFALIQGDLPKSFGPGIEVQIEPALDKAASTAGFTSGLTSYGMLSAGGDAEGPSVLAETLFGAAGALLVLIFVFASFLALMPLMIAAVSILTTFILVFVLTTFSDVSFVVQFLIALIGLGVAIDYSLLVVSRWREERAHGHDNDEAVVLAMQTVPSQHGHRRHAHSPGQRCCRADPVARTVVEHRASHSRRWHRPQASTSRCSAPRSAWASSSMPPSCGRCSCRRWSACSVGGTGGSQAGWPASCESSRRPWRPRRRPRRER